MTPVASETLVLSVRAWRLAAPRLAPQAICGGGESAAELAAKNVQANGDAPESNGLPTKRDSKLGLVTGRLGAPWRMLEFCS